MRKVGRRKFLKLAGVATLGASSGIAVKWAHAELQKSMPSEATERKP